MSQQDRSKVGIVVGICVTLLLGALPFIVGCPLGGDSHFDVGSGSSGGSSAPSLVKLWHSNQAGQNPRSIAVDDSGNIYVTGWMQWTGAGNVDVFLLKYRPDGILEWQMGWDGGGLDKAYGVVIDKTSGSLYVVGGTESGGSDDALLLKYKSDGTLLWQKSWDVSPGNYAYAVDTDDSGNIYITGSVPTGASDAFLLKYDSNGNLLWQKTWGGGTDADIGWAVAVDKISGNIYIAGNTSSFGGGGGDVFLLKYDTNGTLTWQKTWGGTILDEAHGVATDSSGNIYVTGVTYSFGAGDRDAFILKYNSSGTLLWQKTWGGTTWDEAEGIVVDTSGNIYVTGVTDSFDPGWDPFLLKYNTNGNLLWQKIWGGGSVKGGHGMSVDVDSSNVYLVGNGIPTVQLHDISGTTTTPNGTETTPSGTIGTPIGNENTLSGTEKTLAGDETASWGSLLLRITK